MCEDVIEMLCRQKYKECNYKGNGICDRRGEMIHSINMSVESGEHPLVYFWGE